MHHRQAIKTMVPLGFSQKMQQDPTDEEISSDSDSDNESNKICDSTEGNAGWADSIAQVLSTTKPKRKKTLALSKAKRFNKIKTEKSYDFEIDGEVKEEQPTDEKPEQTEIEAQKRKNEAALLRVKPALSDRERERALKKIATKGMVQLFNAVRTQQKDIERKLKEEKLDHKKDAVLNNINKRKFLDVLMSGDRAKSEIVDNLVKKEEMKEEKEGDEKRNPEWGALKDDFMIGKKFKNWDQNDSDSDAQNESDSNSE